MTLTTIVLLVLVLYVVQLFLQETARFGLDMPAMLGTRDNLPDVSVVGSRLERAKNNMQEAMPIFIALAMLALFKGGDMSAATNGALVFLIMRVLYVPAYASGIPALRSILWIASNVGLVMMALPLI